jgi:hypothetical protein
MSGWPRRSNRRELGWAVDQGDRLYFTDWRAFFHIDNHRAMIAQLRPRFELPNLDGLEPRCPLSRNENVVDVVRLVLVVAEVDRRARFLSVRLAEVMVITTD